MPLLDPDVAAAVGVSQQTGFDWEQLRKTGTGSTQQIGSIASNAFPAGPRQWYAAHEKRPANRQALAPVLPPDCQLSGPRVGCGDDGREAIGNVFGDGLEAKESGQNRNRSRFRVRIKSGASAPSTKRPRIIEDHVCLSNRR